MIFKWGQKRNEAPAPLPEISQKIGLIAGNGVFPLQFCERARRAGCEVVAVAHRDETDPSIETLATKVIWVKVGELGKLISGFVDSGVKRVALAGGINRVRLFGGVKLDLRGAALLARIRSTKDDVIMRAIAAELEGEGVQVVPCTLFMEDDLAPEGVLTRARPTEEEQRDIEVGIEALRAMSSQDIGQLVVVREGVVVAVEATEGSDAAIRRGGELGGKGTVVVKFSKVTQDLRFDVPTVGMRTIETLVASKASVLAIEAGRCLILEREKMLEFADKHRVSVVGCPPLPRSE